MSRRWKALATIVSVPLLLACAVALAQGLTREQALESLSQGDPQLRREAASRLGDVGTMADVPSLVRTLRDPDEDTREEAQQALWHIWSRSGDPEIDRLYEVGVEQMSAANLEEAIETFTRIIERKPAFAEAWNKRATLYFLTGELRKSLADCDEVMKRNPYHFGALAGYAQIYIRLEQYDRALEYARRALEVNPNLDGMRRTVEALEHALEERRKRVI
ncbi:MAG TPA: tetratricopeptide repeat protein [Casimicrobiaceae bacterium]|nr:tetratricopeptide repeat protein [Casimicrobiaceae bacterium]